MTNQLFRDYLDGKIHDPARDWAQKVRSNANDPRRIEARKTIPAAFTVPRRKVPDSNTGPPPSASWRGRGRVTKYARG